MSIRDDFFANQAVAALWDVAVSIKRGNPLPLDSNSVFKSYADLETYASWISLMIFCLVCSSCNS